MNFIKPFRVGDEVYVRSGTFKGLNIITEVNVQCSDEGYDVTYATNNGAWIEHSLCTIHRECCAETMEQLHADWL